MQSILNSFKSLSSALGTPGTDLKSFYTEDPITGTVVIHGATNKRPKAYVGEFIACPWDKPKNSILEEHGSFLTWNDFPALDANSLEDQIVKANVGDLYSVKNARGECLMVIYSREHRGHWLSLPKEQLLHVVHLWMHATLRAKEKKCKYTLIFETDGPHNTMTHPHGQQYNFADIPTQIVAEINRTHTYYQKSGTNLFRDILRVELDSSERIIFSDNSWIAFAPPGAKWPFQIRILPKKHLLWLDEMSDEEAKDLVTILTNVRQAYANYFSKGYTPTVMMDILQSPLDEHEDFYRSIFGLRIDFFCTALSEKGEKLMFSLENGSGLIAYGSTPEEIAQKLREII